MTSKSGYAWNLFLTEPDDDLKCLICLGVARDPLQHEECGRLFCKWCIEEYGRDKPCPHCRDQHSSYYVDKRGKRAIQALKVKCSNVERECEWEGTVEALEEHQASCSRVKCSNAERGCQWEGTLEALEKHKATCDYALLPCPNKCKPQHTNQVTQVLRKEMENHLQNHCPQRDHQCQFCGKGGTYTSITQLHPPLCPNKPIACPECKETVLQGRKRKHLDQECQVAHQPCKYVGLGCAVKMKRPDREAHEQDVKAHFDMALDTISTMKEELQQHAITFRVTKFKYKKKRNEPWASKLLYINASIGYYKVCAGVWANGNGDGRGTHVSVDMQLFNGDYENCPFVGSVTFTLLNQLEDMNHHSETLTMTREDNATPHRRKKINKFLPHSALDHDPVKNTQYLKDDTLYLRVEVKVEDKRKAVKNKPWLNYK